MIPVYKPYLSGKEKQYVNQCLDQNWISSKGEFVAKFEQKFANYIGAKFATSVSNGTVAIHLALEALGIGVGDEVIVPSFTYIASVNTIIQTGATPVFVDSLSDTWQIDPKDVLSKITQKTKAVMAVHLYGGSCDMKSLTDICADHELYLVEDCAEAFGTYYQDQHVGTFGDVATFSFFGNKTITTGEGGMVVCRSADVYNKMCLLKNQGVSAHKEYWHDMLAYNYRMTNICAAIGYAQLEQADTILQLKRKIAQQYQAQLKDLPLHTHIETAGTKNSFWMCSIVLDDAVLRDKLRQHLKVNGIETRPFFHPAHTLPHCKTSEDFPVAQDLSGRGINLPSYPELTADDLQLICLQIHKFFSAVHL